MTVHEEETSRADLEIIRSARWQATEAVRKFNAARARGNLKDERKRQIQQELADAALNYYDALHEYRDESALSTPWDERGVDWIEDLATQEVLTEQSLPRHNNATQTVLQPALASTDPHRLRDGIRELHDIAKELGFTPAAKQGEHRTQIDNELIEEVEQWRKQNLS